MGVNYKGLINGNIDPVNLAKLIKSTYGGDNFSIHFTSDLTPGFYYIHFTENYTPEQMAQRPWERNKTAVRRQLAVFIDGECASDYADLTTDPMTLVSLGHHSECREIIDALVNSQGGYIQDELGPKCITEEWVRLDIARAARKDEAGVAGLAAHLNKDAKDLTEAEVHSVFHFA